MADQHTPAQYRKVVRQRDALLSRLQGIVNLGRLGLADRGDTYCEISMYEIRAAERLCKRVRAAIVDATGQPAQGGGA